MRVALITGASGGLGGVLARGLAEEGYTLVLHYLTGEHPARRLSEQLPGKTLIVRADLRLENEVEEMARAVKRHFGRLDLLINNAGITVDKLLLKLKEEEWDRVMAVNLTGAFLVVKHCLKLMPEGSHIINILSRSGLKGRKGQAAYSASKAALLGLTLTLAKELGPRGIRVNAIVPGYLPVGMGPRSLRAMERAREESPFGTLGSAEDVLRIVKALVKSEGITGQVFVADTRSY